MIEILQILSQVHYFYGSKLPPYKKCMLIGKNLAPYVWASESIENYKYCADLAKYLLEEYKFRYKKENHKCEKPLLWLINNIPKKIKKKEMTEFRLTENIKIYGKYFKNKVTASKYIYVDFKCKNDNWGNRKKPKWFDIYDIKSKRKKTELIKKIMLNVRVRLPKETKKFKVRVRRFHSFLRICYDNLFQEKWDKKIKSLPTMFNPKKPLIYQLGLGHLLEVYNISKSLFNKKKLIELNTKSLIFRKKI